MGLHVAASTAPPPLWPPSPPAACDTARAYSDVRPRRHGSAVSAAMTVQAALLFKWEWKTSRCPARPGPLPSARASRAHGTTLRRELSRLSHMHMLSTPPPHPAPPPPQLVLAEARARLAAGVLRPRVSPEPFQIETVASVLTDTTTCLVYASWQWQRAHNSDARGVCMRAGHHHLRPAYRSRARSVRSMTML